MPYIDIADKDTLDRAYLGVSDIQNKLGTTSDSGGGASTTSGTSMAKLNRLISYVGTTTDTVASSSTGSVMGKLNKIVNNVNGLTTATTIAANSPTFTVNTSTISCGESYAADSEFVKVGSFKPSVTSLNGNIIITLSGSKSSGTEFKWYLSTISNATSQSQVENNVVVPVRTYTLGTNVPDEIHHIPFNTLNVNTTYYLYVFVRTSYSVTVRVNVSVDVTINYSTSNTKIAVVKNIQSGLYRYGAGESNPIAITNVVPDNCIVIVNCIQTKTDSTVTSDVGALLTQNKLFLVDQVSTGVQLTARSTAWQIIEFY